MNRLSQAAVPLGALFTVGLALTIALWAAPILSLGANAAARPQLDSSRGTLVSTRDRLMVCVEAGAQMDPIVAADSVRAAVDRMSGGQTFRAAYGGYPLQLTAGCPQPGWLLVSGQTHAKAGGTYAMGRRMDEPSPFRLFVYVVPTSEVGRMFGSLPFQMASQEVMCDGNHCATVTTALYVDAGTVRDQAGLVAELELGLGLRPVYPADPHGGNTPKNDPQKDVSR